MLTWDRQVTAYNELIVDGDHWTSHLPGIVEAFVITSGHEPDALDKVRRMRQRFLQAYGLSATEAPLVTFDEANSHAPFVRS